MTIDNAQPVAKAPIPPIVAPAKSLISVSLFGLSSLGVEMVMLDPLKGNAIELVSVGEI